MNAAAPRLALGTVQFGLRYGVAGRGEAVPDAEARSIIQRASALGIDTLDTASAYGSIEERLASMCDGRHFEVVSKVPALPDGLSEVQAREWAARAFDTAYDRLGTRLKTLLLHRGDDLLGPLGPALWHALSSRCAAHGVALGVSLYEPALLERVHERFPIAAAQLPGNALDQRIAALSASGVCIHLRSAFLQGLLLMPSDQAIARVPASAAYLLRFERWCAQRGWSALPAALSIVKGFRSVSYCVVGVDRLEQLEDVVQAWHAAEAVAAPELACDASDVIDPRTWRIAP